MIFHFICSPLNRCTCPQDQKCVRVSDDISISAFVYRCRTNDESNGLQVLPADVGQEVTGSYVWSYLADESRSLDIWLFSTLLTLTSSFPLTYITTHFTRLYPQSLRKLRFSSNPISFKCWKKERKHPVLDSFLLLDRIIFPYSYSILSSLEASYTVPISLMNNQTTGYEIYFSNLLFHSSLLFLISFRISYRICDLEWRQTLI